MVVRPEAPEGEFGGNRPARSFVAVDFIGAGVGERVLVATGSSARNIGSGTEAQLNVPVDATIVGIVDEMELTGKPKK